MGLTPPDHDRPGGGPELFGNSEQLTERILR